ncbi:hypothetical protein BIW11_04692, partial [Tropilaelaps mercedesae]
TSTARRTSRLTEQLGPATLKHDGSSSSSRPAQTAARPLTRTSAGSRCSFPSGKPHSRAIAIIPIGGWSNGSVVSWFASGRSDICRVVESCADHATPPSTSDSFAMKLFVVAVLAVARGTSALNVHDFPKTAFSCRDKNAGEYYADLELGCQVYHICALGQFNRLTKMSFACPNGTLFSQSSRICNSEDKVYCPLAERYYDNVQGTIDTQDDYRTVFKVDSQPVFPLEPARRRR